MPRAFRSALIVLLPIAAALAPPQARAAECPVTHEQLAAALKASVRPSGGPANGGFENHEWGSVVARDGTVCAVAFTGNAPGDQWPGSRAIAAEKATTANALSLPGFALSSGNLYAGALPGGPLFGLVETNPASAEVIAAGDPAQFGSPGDPMVGKMVGGVVVFGGGLALYNETGIVGGLGVSGDSSCADHNVAWRVRAALGLDKVPAGVNPERRDAIVYDLNHENKSASGFGHPKCQGTEADIGSEIGASVGGEQLR